MRPWKRWTAVAVAVAVLAVGVGRALHKRQNQQAKAATAVATLQSATAVDLTPNDVFVAQPMEVEQGVAFTGTVKAVRAATVKARVAGELQGLQVREGDAVRAGQVLARIDATESQARVRQADQQAQAAQAQVAIAKRQNDNNLALVNQGFISRTALDTSSANLDAAQANFQAAQAALDVARKTLADTQLVAPINGQVAARNAQNGERVAVDARVLDIVDVSAMEIEAALPPADALGVRVGQNAQWSVEGQTQSATARVVRINPAVQAGSRTVLVYLALPNPGGLRQGLFSQGRIHTGSVRAVAVPLTAVRTDKPQPYLQVVREGKIQYLAAKPGAQGRTQGEDMVAIDALPAGTTVLRGSAGSLADGTAVRVVTQ